MPQLSGCRLTGARRGCKSLLHRVTDVGRAERPGPQQSGLWASLVPPGAPAPYNSSPRVYLGMASTPPTALATLPSAFAAACRLSRTEGELFERCRVALVRRFQSEL